VLEQAGLSRSCISIKNLLNLTSYRERKWKLDLVVAEDIKKYKLKLIGAVEYSVSEDLRFDIWTGDYLI
jgi:hypothetical protein